jgi:hypothetical protein
MEMDFQNDKIFIANDLIIHPGYTLDEFMKTRFYKGQNTERIIPFGEQVIIDRRKYYGDLWFKNNKIYCVSLLCVDENFTQETEPQRKIFHDRILKEYNLNPSETFIWGKVLSTYDPRGNVSSIDIFYQPS